MIFDKIVTSGTLIDPEKMTQTVANIGIIKNKIALITKEQITGRECFDATGKIVSPGFIDIHGHVDGYYYSAELSLRQGITTTIGGNCGHSPVDMKEFFSQQKNNPQSINQAELMGMTSSLREAVGLDNPRQPANKEQLKKMQYLVEKAMQDGACGLSVGLAYAPETSDEELYSLAGIAAKYGRIVTVDTRLFTPDDLNSLVEIVTLAKILKIRVQISHFVYQYGTGMVSQALQIVDEARQQGIDIRLDSGMYTEWATGLQAVLFDEISLKESGLKLEDILIVTGKYKGQRLSEKLYQELRQIPREQERISAIVFTGVKEDIYKALKHPYAMPSTDIGRYEKGEGHPQIAGSFPRYFRKMVRENNYLTLTEAVRKATLLPAQTLNLKEKGRLSENADADIVVFDINTIKDNAGFLPKALPDAPPDGIDYVFVNGQLALAKGKLINTKAGKPIIY